MDRFYATCSRSKPSRRKYPPGKPSRGMAGCFRSSIQSCDGSKRNESRACRNDETLKRRIGSGDVKPVVRRMHFYALKFFLQRKFGRMVAAHSMYAATGRGGS